MNLAFETVQGRYLVNFPFQTSTDLSFKVYRATTNQQRIQLIEEQVKAWKWEKRDIDRVMREVKELFNDPTLRLVIV
jgi:hypothetical protein